MKISKLFSFFSSLPKWFYLSLCHIVWKLHFTSIQSYISSLSPVQSKLFQSSSFHFSSVQTQSYIRKHTKTDPNQNLKHNQRYLWFSQFLLKIQNQSFSSLQSCIHCEFAFLAIQRPLSLWRRESSRWHCLIRCKTTPQSTKRTFVHG